MRTSARQNPGPCCNTRLTGTIDMQDRKLMVGTLTQTITGTSRTDAGLLYTAVEITGNGMLTVGIGPGIPGISTRPSVRSGAVSRGARKIAAPKYSSWMTGRR